MLIFAAQVSLHAQLTPLKSGVLENNVTYLRVNDAGKDLADQINAAESTLTVSNQMAGTILDLRFATGEDAAAIQATANLFAAKKLPLAILINGETRGSAEQLALNLHDSHAGLIFGSATAKLQPDIAVTVNALDEKKFLEDPYLLLVPTPLNLTTNSEGTTNNNNNFTAMIDHTSEADLVRQKIKDGEGEEDTMPATRPLLAQPVVRDPALARALDFLKALAVLEPKRG
jgi:hypothetical protein